MEKYIKNIEAIYANKKLYADSVALHEYFKSTEIKSDCQKLLYKILISYELRNHHLEMGNPDWDFRRLSNPGKGDINKPFCIWIQKNYCVISDIDNLNDKDIQHLVESYNSIHNDELKFSSIGKK